MGDTLKTAMAGAALSIGDWVTAGGAGSLTDVGYLKEGSVMSFALGEHAITPDNVPTPVRLVPTTKEVGLKAMLQEVDLDKLAYLLNQPSANLTGIAPNKSLLGGALEEQYKQVTLVTKGIAGATALAATRTITLWRCRVKIDGDVTFSAKSGEQLFSATIMALWDDSVATADKVFKVVDSGGA